jgi:uncharacterized metal-binding protein
MPDCANCGSFACRSNQKEKAPPSCPMNQSPELYDAAMAEYLKPETNRMARVAAIVESTGYGKWTRLEETIEYAWRTGFKRLGLAFCSGLRAEGKIVAKILKEAGFEVESVCCKTGSKAKELIGVKEEEKVRPGNYEAMCNNISQAKILNKAKTDLNIMLGLCVGHDALFLKNSEAPVTVLAVKDRVLAHNPLGAIYAGHYYDRKLARYKKPSGGEK